MGVIIRQGIKGAIANYVGIGIGVINTLFIFPKMLSVEEIGLIRLLLDVGLIFASFAQLGMTTTMVKFYPEFKNNERNQNGFFFYSILITLIGFIFFTIVYYYYSEDFITLYQAQSPLFQLYFEYVYPLTFIMLFIYFFETISFLHSRITIPKIIREIYLRLFTTFAILFYFFKIINQGTLILSIVIIYFFALLFNLINSWMISNMSLSPKSKILNKKFSLRIGVFSAFTIFSTLSGVIVSKIDTLMLGATKGLDDTGIYSIAFFIAMFIEIPKRSIDSITAPIISEKLSQDNFDQVKEINYKSALNLFITSGFIFVIVYINIDNIFTIMPKGNIFATGKNVIFFIGLAKIIESLSGMNSPIISYSKYYKHGTYITFMFSFIGIALNAWLIPKMGIDGAAIATFLTVLIVHLYIHLLVYIKFKIINWSKKTLHVLALLVFIYSINLGITVFENPFIDFFIRSSLLSAIFISLIISLKISSDINLLYDNILLKIRNLI